MGLLAMGQTNTTYNPPETWANGNPVARAQHLFNCFYPYRAAEICAEEGISEEDIELGAYLSDVEKERRAVLRRIHGDPAYGQWMRQPITFKAAEVSKIVRVMMRLQQQVEFADRESRHSDALALSKIIGKLQYLQTEVGIYNDL